jgi:alpha-glucuronidase
MFESTASTPDELLLFFHHVPFGHMLHSGKTVIQHIYDSHYEGAAQAAGFVSQWRRLSHAIDPERYAAVLAKLEYQAGHAVVWRDAINSWFQWVSGIPDANASQRRLPARIEAESMTLDRFSIGEITPWETASGGLAVSCRSGGTCAADYTYTGTAGRFDLAIQYFDENDGASRFTFAIDGRDVDSWTADGDFLSAAPNGHTSIRRTIRGIDLKAGTKLQIRVMPNGPEGGVLDYIEIAPAAP